jgi:N-acetylmuramoyl-L-alanine amidase
MKKITIFLDEGHYDGCPGKRSPKFEDGSQFFEWKYCREIGKRIKEQCDALGIKCIRTTNKNNQESLTKRAAHINDLYKREKKLGRSALMISIHGNAAGNEGWKTATGWEVYTTKGTTNSDKFAKIMCSIFPSIFPDKKLRGHKEANFSIILKTACPCVLTENFFYDNKEECEWMQKEEVIEKIVSLHIESIKKWVEYDK